MVGKYRNIEDKEYELLGGNLELMQEYGIRYNFESENSVYLFAINKRVIATFELEDEIKPDAKDLISYLKKENLDVIMLTGDNEKVASKISSQLGIYKYYSKQTPVKTAKFIKKIKAQKKK